MTKQLSLFDEPAAAPVVCAPTRPAAGESERLKREGMALAAESRESLLAHARGLALDVARGILPHADGEYRADGLCHADDVAAAWAADAIERERLNLSQLPTLGNAAGSIFAGERQVWEPTDKWVKSTRPHAHQNRLLVWKLRQKPEKAAD